MRMTQCMTRQLIFKSRKRTKKKKGFDIYQSEWIGTRESSVGKEITNVNVKCFNIFLICLPIFKKISLLLFDQ